MRWIIGDVHGMRAPLARLLEEVGKVDPAPRFYFVGDYVNRGPDAKGVVELLLKLPNARFCRGNHDDIFDQVLNDRSYADNAAHGHRATAYQWFMEYGLDQTFMSYGVDMAVLESCRMSPTDAKLDAICAAVPESHRKFFRELPPVIEDDDLFVAHAKWDPDEPDRPVGLAKQLGDNSSWRHKLLWGRFSDDEIGRTKAWARAGFFGHTPVFAYAASQRTGDVLMLPILGQKIVLLDTGVALNPDGRLTAFCPDNLTFIQTDRLANLVLAPAKAS